MAQYLYNCPEYLESMFAAFKAGLVPVNTNYRYLDDELVYLWDNADAVAVVFHGTFTDRIERIRDRAAPACGTGSGSTTAPAPCPDWADAYEEAAATTTERVVAPWGRAGDDLLMLYTGGTTGMPKGVMWRQDDLFARHVRHRQPAAGRGPRGRSADASATPVDGPGAGRAARLPAHARHRLVHGQHRT